MSSSVATLLYEVADLLKRERLVLRAEQQEVNRLQDENLQLQRNHAETVWLEHLQRSLLHGLQKGDVQSESWMAYNSAMNVSFIDSHKRLSYHDVYYAEFINTLRGAPRLLAHVLTYFESKDETDNASSSLQSVCNILTSSVFSGFASPDSEWAAAQVLIELLRMAASGVQGDVVAFAKRVKRAGGAVQRMLRCLVDSASSAKVFVSAALREPIVQVICTDDWFYDIDPDKTMHRFSKEDQRRRFGEPSSPEYATRVRDYRAQNVTKLVAFANAGLSAIENAVGSFPSPLRLVAHELYKLAVAAFGSPSAAASPLVELGGDADVSRDPRAAAAARTLCTELLVTNLLCTALCDPETTGIVSEMHISLIARHNLMQVGQILHVLFVLTMGQVDVRTQDLYSNFDWSRPQRILDRLLGLGGAPQAMPEAPVASGAQFALIEAADLNTLVLAVREVLTRVDLNVVEPDALNTLISTLSQLPQTVPSLAKPQASPGTSQTLRASAEGGSPRQTPTLRRKAAANKDPSRRSEPLVDLGDSPAPNGSLPQVTERQVLVLTLPVPEPTDRKSPTGASKQSSRTGRSDAELLADALTQASMVPGDPASNAAGELQARGGASAAGAKAELLHGEKRTRFSLTHESEVAAELQLLTLGSENEVDGASASSAAAQFRFAFGEAANSEYAASSTRSVVSGATSCDLDDAESMPASSSRAGADTFETMSDLQSTNVSASGPASGRLSPDTDVDAPTSGNANSNATPTMAAQLNAAGRRQPANAQAVASALLRIPVTVRKANNDDVTDRFGRFDITLDATECRSTISDSWSTDVITSDCELTADAAAAAAAAQSQIANDYALALQLAAQDDVIDRRSEDAWSVEVEASDSEGEKLDRLNDELVAASNSQPGGAEARSNTPTLCAFGGDDDLDDFYETDAAANSAYSAGDAEWTQVTNYKAARASAGASVSPVNPQASAAAAGGSLADVRTPPSGAAAGASLARASFESDEVDRDRDEVASHRSAPSGSSTKGQSASTSGRTGAMVVFDGSLLALSSNSKKKPSSVKTPQPATASSFLRSFKDKLSGRPSPSRAQPAATDASKRASAPNSRPNAPGFATAKPSVSAAEPPLLSADDILAKYKLAGKSTSNAAANGNGSGNGKENDTRTKENELLISLNEQRQADAESGAGETLMEAQQKLSVILSWINPAAVCSLGNDALDAGSRDNVLTACLRMQLAEANYVEDKQLAAQLEEAIRVVIALTNPECGVLLRAIRDEARSRLSELAALLTLRQQELVSRNCLQRAMKRTRHERAAIERCFATLAVRRLLERFETRLIALTRDFERFVANDEKVECVENLLDEVRTAMRADGAWSGASDEQLTDAFAVCERAVMSRVYLNAMFPNGDADFTRDRVFATHIASLAQIVTPDHKDLRIPRAYHRECPWLSAQYEIKLINAYKTPRDKVQCVKRCASTIMNLLVLAKQSAAEGESSAARRDRVSGRGGTTQQFSPPNADDLIPVLVYVLIKANPSWLLSTVQFVTMFYEKQMRGEDQYCWMQFCSAIEFIKMMIQNNLS